MSDQYAEKLYSMELHEHARLGPAAVVRVPGGWVYENEIGGMCFVPFHNEFEPTGRPPRMRADDVTEGG